MKYLLLDRELSDRLNRPPAPPGAVTTKLFDELPHNTDPNETRVLLAVPDGVVDTKDTRRVMSSYRLAWLQGLLLDQPPEGWFTVNGETVEPEPSTI